MLVVGSMINLFPGISIRPFLINMQQKSIEWVEEKVDEKERKNVSMAYRILTGEQSIASDKSIENTQKGKETKESESVQADAEKNTKDIMAILDKYSSGRIQIWKSGFERWKKNPLFGGGLYRMDNFIVKPSDGHEGAISLSYFTMHNDYIQAYVSGGILGGSVFVIYIVYILLKTRRNFAVITKNMSIEDRLKAGALLALVVGGLFAGMLLTVIYFDCFATGAIFWCYFGFLAQYIRMLKDQKNYEVE